MPPPFFPPPWRTITCRCRFGSAPPLRAVRFHLGSEGQPSFVRGQCVHLNVLFVPLPRELRGFGFRSGGVFPSHPQPFNHGSFSLCPGLSHFMDFPALFVFPGYNVFFGPSRFTWLIPGHGVQEVCFFYFFPRWFVTFLGMMGHAFAFEPPPAASFVFFSTSWVCSYFRLLPALERGVSLVLLPGSCPGP